MKVKSLIYFTTIAKEGSLSKAGRKLQVSQPTLSIFLSNLEVTLGVDLFLREKKQLILTPAGRIYLKAAEQILHVRDQTYQTIYRLTHEITETIVIGATPLRGAVMVAQIFSQFCKRFPNVKVEIKEAYMKELRDYVQNGVVNCALVSCYDSDTTDFDYMIISKEEIVLGVPAFHPMASLAKKTGNTLVMVDIQKFADSPFVLSALGTTVRAISDNIILTAGFHPTVVFETSNNLVLSNMIRQGAGVGFLPRSAMVRDAEDIVYFSIQPGYFLKLGLMVQKNRQLSKAERYFAYLVINRDRKNPLYQSALNAYSEEICEEFDQSTEEDS